MHCKSALSVLLGAAFLTALPTSFLASSALGQQDIHPTKGAFRDLTDWPQTSPRDVELRNFTPFRAVYDRSYRQGAGPNAGDTRKDHVYVTADRVGWDGREAAAITIVDSGIVEHEDTNARVTTMFVDAKNLSALFEIGPIPGKAKDYYIGRMDPGSVRFSMILTEAQSLEPRSMETDEVGFGPGTWAIACMDLESGKKIKLGPFFSPGGNTLTSTQNGHVLGQKDVEDSSGNSYKAWQVETSRNPASPRVSHLYLIDQPPYYLGTESVNLETGERTRFAWLRSFQELEG